MENLIAAGWPNQTRQAATPADGKEAPLNLHLDEEQGMLRDSLDRLFQKDSTSAAIRAAEPLGFDPALWSEIVALGIPLMRVPVANDGADLSLMDAVLVAESVGTYLASVPILEAIVANQALARLGGDLATTLLAQIADGSKIVTLALRPVVGGVPQLIPAGAIADGVICCDGDVVYLVEQDPVLAAPANLGTMSISEQLLDLGGATRLGVGAKACAHWYAAVEEWKLLAAAASAACGRKALTEASVYANERKAFDRAIGSYQGLAHPLADAVTEVEGARLLCWRAATERDASLRPGLISAAYWWAVRATVTATVRAMRTYGGYGMTMEYDAQIYFRRSRAWSMLPGDPENELILLGDRLWHGRDDPTPDIGETNIDFGLGHEALSFGEQARSFFTAHMTPEMERFTHETDDGNHPFNQELAAAGFLYADWPSEYGGGNRSAYEMAALNEVHTEFSWPKVPATVTHMVGKILMHCATEELKREIMPRLSTGKAHVALGYSEPSCGSDIFAAKTRAVRDGDAWIIDGQKMFTSQGHLASHVLLIARTDPNLPKHAGLTLFLVPVDIPGFEVHEVKTLGGERTNITYYANMRVPDRYRVGDVNGGVKVLGKALTLEQGGGEFHVSALRIMLRHAVKWARTVQTDGRRPIEAERVRARLAAVHTKILVADVLDKRCQWAFVEKVTGKYFGPMAKLFASESLISCSTDLAEISAPWSLLQGHTDLGVVELESRKAIQATIYGGTSLAREVRPKEVFMSDSDLLKSEKDGILELILNRPKKYNAINLAIADGIYAALLEFRQRRDLRVMLIRANGRYFSAGADLTDVGKSDMGVSSSEDRTWYRSGRGSFHPMFDEMEAIEKPIVVAHQGPCLGGGLEMSLSCDFRFAAASARYQLPEIDIGVMPGSGGTSRLVRFVGAHWARWLVLAGESVSAEQALSMGLVHDVFPDEGFEVRVRAFCEKLTKLPPEAVAISKLTIEMVADLDRQQARNVERLGNSVLFQGAEYKNLVTAMIERLSSKRT
jgi:alkylation response protein AidB-like acyl-CoA dehydrogenase/enoyl-CoA hydratase/carnithine racemase